MTARRRRYWKPSGRKSGEGVDRVTCRHCAREFRAITLTHLVRRHGYDREHPIEDYKARFGLVISKCEETVAQGREKFLEVMEARGQRWTPERVLRTIREERRAGRPLHCAAIRIGTLVDSGVRFFGSWDAALSAAGLDPREIRQARPWTREDVLTAIRELPEIPRPRQATVGHSALIGAATRRFGSWVRAVRAAGRTLPPTAPPHNRKWTREAVLRAIRDRVERGLPIDSHTIQTEVANALYQNALAAFGGWREAVAAAGCADALPWQCWTRTEFVRLLREIKRKHGKVTHALLARERRANYIDPNHAVRRLFGSLRKAVAAAGIVWHEKPPWSRVRIVEVLRERARRRLPLNMAACPQDVRMAVITYIGTWDDALRAAGLDPGKVRLARTWTHESVLAAIRAEIAAGRPVNYKAMESRDLGLLHAAIHRFGTWGHAVEQAEAMLLASRTLQTPR